MCVRLEVAAGSDKLDRAEFVLEGLTYLCSDCWLPGIEVRLLEGNNVYIMVGELSA